MQNTVLKLSEFVVSGEKENGVTDGFVATRKGKTYVMKAFNNGNLTQETLAILCKRFKNSFISSTATQLKKMLPDLNHEDIDIYSELEFKKITRNIIPDDLNLASCIREYLSALIYKALLGDDAPEIYLVKDDNDPTKIYLASKFIPNFTTVFDHIQNKTDSEYNKAERYERILAAQILAGESDIIQTGNFGVISKEGQIGHFGKVDHGGSLLVQNYDFVELGKLLLNVRSLGIKIKTSELISELKKQAKILDNNRQKIELQIKERVQNLEKVLNNHGLTFILKTHDDTVDDKKTNPFVSTQFHYDKGHFISDDGKTLEEYFIAEFRRYKDRSNFLVSNLTIINSRTICLISSAILFACGTFLAKFYEAKIIDKLGKNLQIVILTICALVSCVSLCIFLKIFLYNILACKIMDGSRDSKLLEIGRDEITENLQVRFAKEGNRYKAMRQHLIDNYLASHAAVEPTGDDHDETTVEPTGDDNPSSTVTLTAVPEQVTQAENNIKA